MPGPPRRRPMPYDAIIDGQGVMLGAKDEKGHGLVGTKVQPFIQAAPNDYKYDTQPPLFERVQPYNDLTLGFGLRKQGSYADRKYRFSRGVDCSIAGLFVKGPHITTYTPTTTDGTRDGYGGFFTLAGSQFLAMGRYILQRISDSSWTVAEDFGASAYVVSVTVFASSGTGTVLAWASLNGANKAQWSADGLTWVAADGTASKPNQASLAYIQVGNEFWRASDVNQMSKCNTDADPTVAINWTNPNSFRIGDKSSPIVSLSVSSTGSLLVFKTDGVYTINEAGDSLQLFASVAQGGSTDTENGRYTGLFGNNTHFSYSHQHLRAVPSTAFGGSSLELEEVGPEKFTENDSEVRGRITAFVGDGAMAAWAALYNEDSGTSYLVKFSAWLTPGMSEGKLDVAQRIDTWHGALDAPDPSGNPMFANKKITHMTRSQVGAGAGHYRIYGACSDGTIFWFNLSCVPNPTACDEYLFTTREALLYLPYWTGTFEADMKVVRAVTIMSTTLSGSNSLRFDYRIAPDVASYTSIGTTFTHSIRQREEFPNHTGIILGDFRVAFLSSATTSSPVVTAITIHHAVRPALQLTYEFSVLLGEHMIRRDGSPYKSLGAPYLRSVVRAAVEAIGSIEVILPDQSTQALTFVDYKEALAFDTRLRTWYGSLDCVAVQYTTNTSYGTWGRAAQYSWQDLLAYTWTQVAAL